MVFLALKKLVTLSTPREKNFFSNFESYNLTNGEEYEFKFWCTWSCTSYVLDPTVTYFNTRHKMENLTLHWKRAVLRVKHANSVFLH